MILVDTSAWVEYLRGTGSLAAVEVRRLITERTDDIAMCEPVAMEILAGATGANYPKIERLVNGLASLPVEEATDFRSSSDLYRAARRAGRTVRSLIDCLIASIAIRHDVEIVHCDADFDTIATIGPLRARWPR